MNIIGSYQVLVRSAYLQSMHLFYFNKYGLQKAKPSLLFHSYVVVAIGS